MALLKEFGLDAESLPKKRRHQFALQTRCVSAHFERVFAGRIKGEAWKVLVDCIDGAASIQVRNLLGVVAVQRTFSFSEFEAASDTQKKQIALDALCRGAQHAAKTCGWNPQSFLDARDAIVAADYRNEWVWRELWNGGRTLRARVLFRHDVKTFSAALEVSDRAGRKSAAKRVVESLPDEFLFHAKFGKLRWSSRSTVSLIDKDGKVVASVEAGGRH